MAFHTLGFTFQLNQPQYNWTLEGFVCASFSLKVKQTMVLKKLLELLIITWSS